MRGDKEPERDHNKPTNVGKLEERETGQGIGAESLSYSRRDKEAVSMLWREGGRGDRFNKNSWKLKI